MSNMQARVTVEDNAFHVEGYEKIEYDLLYVDGIFVRDKTALADCYRPYGRALMVIDETVYDIYRQRIHTYFGRHGIDLTVVPVQIRETAKSLETFERIVGAVRCEFGLVRTEPVLIVGGGLTTDVAGFACASYRRNTPYIRIPTTLIGLIDASVSIKVAVNLGKNKNRLGAYHASQKVFLDFSFLATLPTDQVRNGMAELIKIAVVGNEEIFDLLETYGPTFCAPTSAIWTARRNCAGRSPPDIRGHRHDARTRGAELARDRSGPSHRVRPHLESHTGTHSADTVLPRPCDQHRHGAVGHAGRAAGATFGRRPGPDPGCDERAGAGARQRPPDGGSPRPLPRRRFSRPETACCAPPCPAPSGSACSSTTSPSRNSPTRSRCTRRCAWTSIAAGTESTCSRADRTGRRTCLRFDAQRPVRARPVTPTTILAAELCDVNAGLDAWRGAPQGLLERLHHARDLADGLDPYLRTVHDAGVAGIGAAGAAHGRHRLGQPLSGDAGAGDALRPCRRAATRLPDPDGRCPTRTGDRHVHRVLGAGDGRGVA